MQQIKNIPPKILGEGIAGHYVHGASMSFGLVELKKGSAVPLHQHIHEQITYILSGELEMEIGGEKYLLTEGMYHVIPSQTPHSAIARTDCRLIDVFSPAREEYKSPVSAEWKTV